jgi:HlyD family secretion protein
MVEVSAPNPRKELLPGMTANVRIVTDARADVLKVPNAALRFRPAGANPQKAGADSPAPAAPAGGPAAQGRAMRERLVKELALDDTQQAKLETIFAGLRDKMMAAREAPAEERQKLSERHRQDMRMQVADMLTPEQKKKYEAIVAELGERRGATTKGRIYLLGADKQPKELEVRLGLSDGTTTEVISPEVQAGMEVITGTAQAANADKRSRQPAGPRMF